MWRPRHVENYGSITGSLFNGPLDTEDDIMLPGWDWNLFYAELRKDGVDTKL
jgi:hypothetical protein